jgi:hypothetical protein
MGIGRHVHPRKSNTAVRETSTQHFFSTNIATGMASIFSCQQKKNNILHQTLTVNNKIMDLWPSANHFYLQDIWPIVALFSPRIHYCFLAFGTWEL